MKKLHFEKLDKLCDKCYTHYGFCHQHIGKCTVEEFIGRDKSKDKERVEFT